MADSLGLRYVTSSTLPMPLPAEADVQFSPDRSKFFFVTRQGNLAADSNVVQVHIFSTSDVVRVLAAGQSAPPFSVTATWESVAVSETSILMLRWDEDSQNILFTGAKRDGDAPAAFAIDARSGRIRQIAKGVGEVEWVRVRGSSIVIGSQTYGDIASLSYPVGIPERLNALGRDELDSPIRTDRLRVFTARRATFVSYRGRSLTRLPVTLLGGPVLGSEPAISPDGRLAVGIDREGRGFTLIDLERGTARQILDLRGGGFSYESAPEPHAIWLPGSGKVVLINVVAPGEGGRSGSAVQYVGVYDVSAGKWSTITCFDPARGECDATGRVEAVVPAGENRIAVLRREGDRSSETIYDLTGEVPTGSPPGSPSVQLRVDVLQSANDPPRVVASLGDARVELLGADPSLAGVRLARQSPFRWKEGESTVTGGLYLPPGYRPGIRLPLVIQAYHYLPDQFRPDGAFSGDAAQLLAARGFAVLQYEIPAGGRDEGAAVVRRFEAAVAALSSAGIVDPARVGVSGFSRAGFQVLYLITHPGKFVPAAAITIDSWGGDYPGYLEEGAGMPSNPPVSNEYEKLWGGNFWRHKQDWLTSETLFNVDRVQTPLLLTNNDISGGDSASDAQFNSGVLRRIGAFRLNRRPLEYWYFPYGDHNLVRPRQRQAMLGGTVDWMAFWLMGFEDPDPEKADQYARWRRLRDAWRGQQAWEAAGHPVGSLPQQADPQTVH